MQIGDMGILNKEQIMAFKRQVTEEAAEPKVKRRIYFRPKRVIKRAKQIMTYEPKTVVCKFCHKRIPVENAILEEGGGVQGHKSFWICDTH